MMFVVASSSGLPMKFAIKNQTVAYQDTITDEIRSGCGPRITDFFEARHQLMIENREIDNIPEVSTRVDDNLRYKPPLFSAELVESALYWFISAPALLYLIYLIARPSIGIMP
jgi:hypothetical protein